MSNHLDFCKFGRTVLSVTGNVSDMSSHIAESRARYEFREKLMKVLYP
jgi:hypothetical protein